MMEAETSPLVDNLPKGNRFRRNLFEYNPALFPQYPALCALNYPPPGEIIRERLKFASLVRHDAALRFRSALCNFERKLGEISALT